MKTIGIIGGTGFVGTYITNLLAARGYSIIIFTRNVNRRNPNQLISYAEWDAVSRKCDTQAISKLDAAVHLAGAGVADKRWTIDRKKEILDSRVNSTEFLHSQLSSFAPQCKIFIAASATGFYGPSQHGQPAFTEIASPCNDFLGTTCRLWEESSLRFSDHYRTVVLRIGIVLGKESGAFPEFIKPIKWGIMPVLGSGDQVVSWIEVSDLAGILLYALENEKMSGIYNAVAPQPVTHRALMQASASVMGGIRIPVPVPAWLLKIMLGELSIEVLKSCNVSAQKITDAGFTFRYSDIHTAVKNIIKN